MSMIPNLQIREKTYYVGEVIRDGKVIQRSAKSGNLIVDAGWAVARASNSLMLYMAPCVGTGSTPPAVTDTALAAFLYGTANDVTLDNLAEASTITNSGDAAGTVPRYSNIEQSFTWTLGAVVGNVTEVGMYITTDRTLAPPTGSLYSRALFVDGGGAPVTLVVTASDYFRITVYRERHTQQTNITGSFNYTLEGVLTSVGYEAQPQGRNFSNLNNSNSWHTVYNGLSAVADSPSPLLICGFQAITWGVGSTLGRFFSSPIAPAAFPTIWTSNAPFSASGSSTFPSSMVEPTVASVVGDTITVEGNFGPSTGNTTTIHAWTVACGYACWSIKFNSPLQKTNLQSLVFSFSVTFNRNV